MPHSEKKKVKLGHYPAVIRPPGARMFRCSRLPRGWMGVDFTFEQSCAPRVAFPKFLVQEFASQYIHTPVSSPRVYSVECSESSSAVAEM